MGSVEGELVFSKGGRGWFEGEREGREVGLATGAREGRMVLVTRGKRPTSARRTRTRDMSAGSELSVARTDGSLPSARRRLDCLVYTERWELTSVDCY